MHARIVATPGVVFIMVQIVCGCPAGQYPADPPAHTCQTCPPHTTIAAPAESAHDCKCDAGFLCMYYRRVHATVALNTTMSDFESDRGGVRSSFVSGLAAAAGVQAEQVRIHFVVIRLNHRRRHRMLLSAVGGGVSVGVMISGARSDEAVLCLRDHLARMHIPHESWEVQRRVLVLAIPTDRI